MVYYLTEEQQELLNYILEDIIKKTNMEKSQVKEIIEQTCFIKHLINHTEFVAHEGIEYWSNNILQMWYEKNGK